MESFIEKNIVDWIPEDKPKFLFERVAVSVKGQPESFDFSMVIAVYNAEKYVGETIESILNQEYDISKIQIILVDDGSKDGSFAVCSEYALKYPENIVLVHKENGGVSSARNVGMRFVKGKYINFIDSDDLISANTCKNVFDFFKKYENKTDVVTIKTELFGAKKGDTWFNNKFAKGDRLIDLWKEPQVYLNSTSFTFFHSRISNQLAFDEKLCISEDLKVVNSVLMNKWTLGVLSSCKYYYRMHTADESSLSSSARMKDNWYFTYLDRVFMWLYNKAQAQTSGFPEFLQYTLYRDLFNRFNENRECVKVLSPEQISEYKEKLFDALSLISDKVIRSVDVINTDFQVYFYSKKYGKPVILTENDRVHFAWEDAGVDIPKKLSVMYENCAVKKNTVTLEGYVIVNNVGLEIGAGDILFELDGIGPVKAEIFTDTTNDKLAFADEYIFYRKYFRLEVSVDAIKDSALKAYIFVDGNKLPISFAGNGKWFGVNADVPNSYYAQGKVVLYFVDRTLHIAKAGIFKKHSFEKKYVKYLKEQGKVQSEYKKAYMIRLAHKLLRVFKLRPVWIIEDRMISAGDNGEAFYRYLKRKWWINKYFVLSRDSGDFEELKKQGFKLLDPESKDYKFKYLIADVLASSMMEDGQVMPISNKLNPDIIQKKKYVFLQHGIIKDDLSSVYSRKRQKIDLFVTSAIPEYESVVNNTMYFCGNGVARLCGLPRFDRLYNNDKKILLIMPTWRRSLVDHMDHTTGHWVMKPNFENSYYFKFYSALMSDVRLHEALSRTGYKLYYFPHSNMYGLEKYFSGIDGVHIVENGERDYNKFFAEASLMVTDYSSTMFDFGYLRKPIVFCQGDEEEFFGSHTYTKGYFDYRRDAFGDVTVGVEEAVNAIVGLLENGCHMEEKYLERVNRFFPYNDRNNCKRVYDAIRKL